MAKKDSGTGKTPKGKGAVAQTGKARANDTVQLISEATLKKLLKQNDAIKEEMDGLSGSLRESIANAVEKHHLHKGAFADLKRFYRMKSNERLAEWWDTLLAYMEMSGVMARIESVGKLPLDGDSPEEAGNADEDETQGKVARPQFGAGARRPEAAAAE